MTQAHSMDDAVKLAFQQAAPGNTVLLAPACASFDMFQNYEHRGREFKAAVGRLQGQGQRTGDREQASVTGLTALFLYCP